MQNEHNAQLVNNVISSARELLERSQTKLVRNYQIADSILRVTASSEFLIEKYLSSINHLACTDPNSDFDILLLDSESCAAPYPSNGTVYNAKAPLLSSGVTSCEDRFLSVAEGEHIFYAADLKEKIAVCWLRGQSYLQDYLPARPLRNLIHWWMAPRKYQLLHAGAVGNEHGAVLFVGPSSSGKSTTCIRLLTSGMDFLGDDFVMIGPSTTKSGLSVFNLYTLARIQQLPPALEQIKGFTKSTVAYEGKLSVPLYPYFRNSIKNELALQAIVCPYIGKHTGSLVAVSKSHAFRRTIPTLGYLPGHEKLTINNISDCIAQIPCYSLELGDNFEQASIAIKELLARTI